MPRQNAFAHWLAKKNRLDRGLKLLHSINPDRLDDDTDEGRSLFAQLTLAAVAIDCSMNILNSGQGDTKTMKRAFRSWVIHNHTFCDVMLDRAVYNKFSDGHKTMFTEVCLNGSIQTTSQQLRDQSA
mmetsp:Transcript_41135/g.124260  ORF Transcript_41135/g.124260 Transcript_41135/m.124260 type:complete len:127 (-) Transcript_41135:3100-3480(-)